MQLTLVLPPGYTVSLQLSGRVSGSNVGGPISGVPDVGNTTLYVFDLTGKPDGDYLAQLSGISTPNGPPFCLRIDQGIPYIAGSWTELDFINPDVDLPASSVTQITGFWKVYNKAGALATGITVFLRISKFPKTHRGVFVDDSVRSSVSDGDGIASFTNLFPGATYEAWLAGSSRKMFVTVPAGQTSNYAMGSLVG